MQQYYMKYNISLFQQGLLNSAAELRQPIQCLYDAQSEKRTITAYVGSEGQDPPVNPPYTGRKWRKNTIILAPVVQN